MDDDGDLVIAFLPRLFSAKGVIWRMSTLAKVLTLVLPFFLFFVCCMYNYLRTSVASTAVAVAYMVIAVVVPAFVYALLSLFIWTVRSNQ